MDGGLAKLDGRARWATAALLATALADVAAFAADVWQWSLLGKIERGELVDPSTADTSDTFVAVTAILQLVTLVAAVVFFIRWFHLSYASVHPDRRRFGTGWAIGAWFVPILNLWRPKQIANDIWHATGPGPVAPILNWWWGAFVVSSWIDNVAFRAAFGASDRTASLLAAVSDALDVVAAVLAVLAVRAITRRQLAAGAAAATASVD